MNNILDILTDNVSLKKEITYFYDKYTPVRTLTYQDILSQAQSYAKNLQVQVKGAKKPVLISLETSSEFLFSFFGVILAGHIPVPVSSSTLMLPKDHEELIKQISKSCDAKFIITKNKIKNLDFISISPAILEAKLNLELKRNTIQEDDVCFIQFSSGSTQTPKGVAVSHKNILANLEQITQGMQVTPMDSICSWLPLHHDMGLVGVLLASLYKQVPSHLMAPLDFILSPKSWMQLISDEKISVIVAPNSAYNACTKKVKELDKQNMDFTRLRLALSGAEPVNKMICENFISHFQKQGMKKEIIFPVYGLAECTLAVTFNPIENSFHSLSVNYDQLIKNSEVRIEKASADTMEIISVGKPLPGINLEIRNGHGKALTEQNVGEVFIKGPAIVNNYYQRESHLQNGWLASGDLGFLYNSDLYLVGRKKDLIIINGKNIAAHDIEAKACTIPQLKLGKTVAFSFSNKKLEEQVRIVAEVCETGLKNRDKIKAQLCEAIKTIVPLTPKDITLIPPLLIKKTTSGKIKRFYIKDMYLKGHVQRWETNFKVLFLRSQFIILKVRIQFTLKNIATQFFRNKHKQIETKEENRYQYGIK